MVDQLFYVRVSLVEVLHFLESLGDRMDGDVFTPQPVQHIAYPFRVAYESAGPGCRGDGDGEVCVVHGRILNEFYRVADDELIGIALLSGSELSCVLQRLSCGRWEEIQIEPIGFVGSLPGDGQGVDRVRLWNVDIEVSGNGPVDSTPNLRESFAFSGSSSGCR